IDDEAFAALDAADAGLAATLAGNRILQAVTHRLDDAGCGREHAHAAPGGGGGQQAEVGALVAVVGGAAAAEVARVATRVDIDVMLKETGPARLAVEGEGELQIGL